MSKVFKFPTQEDENASNFSKYLLEKSAEEYEFEPAANLLIGVTLSACGGQILRELSIADKADKNTLRLLLGAIEEAKEEIMQRLHMAQSENGI